MKRSSLKLGILAAILLGLLISCGDPGEVIDDDSGSNGNTDDLVTYSTSGEYKITLRFTDNNLSEAEQAEFKKAADRWSDIITADISDVSGVSVPAGDSDENINVAFSGDIDDIHIDVGAGSVDGAEGTLAYASPCVVRDSGRRLTAYGIMFYDTADTSDSTFYGTILHEMGHVFGIGTLWEPSDMSDNDLVAFTGKTDDNNCDTISPKPTDMRYTGSKAAEAYSTLAGSTQNSVPISYNAGEGSDCGHWRESHFLNELMDPNANENDDPLSTITIGSLEDLGYTVDYSKADAYTIPTCAPSCELDLAGVSKRHANWEIISGPKFSVSSTGVLKDY